MVKTRTITEYYDDYTGERVAEDSVYLMYLITLSFPFEKPINTLEKPYPGEGKYTYSVHLMEHSLIEIGRKAIIHLSKKYNNYESFIDGLKNGKF